RCTVTKSTGTSANAQTTIVVNAAYTCSTGTLTNDATKGWICVVSSLQTCYDECPDGHYWELVYTYECQEYSTRASCSDCGYTENGCATCTYCSRSSNIGRYVPVGSCTPQYVCSYYCPSGTSTYSGSGSNLKCYKAATTQ
ncbi:MAG TPA: hypothetical protein GX747_00080, partial [Tenericutes bacterium]|nr:hypothetical protein [Mycoplasmatota bacterium]